MDAGPNEVGRDGYAVWLKTQLSEQREQYKENEFELKRFDDAVERINEYLDNDVDPAANGIAIFASLNDETPFFEAVQLEVPFEEDQFYSYDRPHIFPITQLRIDVKNIQDADRLKPHQEWYHKAITNGEVSL